MLRQLHNIDRAYSEQSKKLTSDSDEIARCKTKRELHETIDKCTNAMQILDCIPMFVARIRISSNAAAPNS